jgi:hypothetical protein
MYGRETNFEQIPKYFRFPQVFSMILAFGCAVKKNPCLEKKSGGVCRRRGDYFLRKDLQSVH